MTHDTGRKIIFFELNEVPWRVLEEYADLHPRSALREVLQASRTFETTTDDGKLSPWTTWPTVHRGVVDRQHTIHEFGQALDEVDSEFPPVWEILRRAGVSTGVFGSLHTYPLPQDRDHLSFFVPDTFAAGPECLPADLEVFQSFNLSMARESARQVSRKIDWGAALRFLASAPRLGLKASTMIDLGDQILGETLQSWKQIRRRAYQAVLAFDMFMRQLECHRPQFVTFFTNHVASSMHRYWAAAYPEDYQEFGFDDQWKGRYRNEIDFTMGKFDQMLRRLITFCRSNPDHLLIVASSMGQAATLARELETELMLLDLGKFLSAIGVPQNGWTRRPAMVPQSNFAVTSEFLEVARNGLRSVRINDQPIECVESDGGFFSVTFGHQNLHDSDVRVTLHGRAVSLDELGLAIVKIDDRCGATAYHVPQGSLLIFDPKRRAAAPSQRLQVSTVEVAPALLQSFGVPVPGYMERGRSILDLM